MSDEGVRVTLRDVYDAVNDLAERLHEVQTTLAVQARTEDSRSVRDADMETRMRAVERRVWALPSLAGVLGLISVAISVLGLRHW